MASRGLGSNFMGSVPFGDRPKRRMPPRRPAGLPRLDLFVGATGMWMVEWADTPEAAKVRDLFGTTVLPTPYLAGTPGATVKARIERSNPQYTVRVR